ncbi:MAG: helix-turn-helix domain-containing protein [Pirellulales bacterium]|nr:helix-turn-helix domain-containing protein [Pirellulales bacterium]
MTRTFSPKELAERYEVATDKVIAWIRSGELSAFDVGSKPGSQRPRYRISENAIESFEIARSIQPPTPRTRRRRRDPNVKEFF